MTDLFLMRHAKSAYPPGVPDHLRPLSPRGERNADAAAQWLSHIALRTVLLSPATRTRETWRILQRHQDLAEVQIVDELYDASAEQIAAAIADWASGPTLVLGHNPGLQACVLAMARGDELHYAEVAGKFPTSAIAHLCDGVLTNFVIPR
jgi:phosphohistidine phosphatase